jgi:hypothetical protein
VSSQPTPDAREPHTRDVGLRALRDALAGLDLDDNQRRVLDGHLVGTLEFWNIRASRYNRVHAICRFAALVAGLAVPAIAAADLSSTTTKRLVAFFGLLAAALIGVDGNLNLGERWLHYRLAAERLRSELWRFASLIGPYEGRPSHPAAFPLLAGRAEELIAGEAGAYVRGPALSRPASDPTVTSAAEQPGQA